MPGSTFLMLRRPELSLLGMSETFILLRFSHFLPLVFSEMRGGYLYKVVIGFFVLPFAVASEPLVLTQSEVRRIVLRNKPAPHWTACRLKAH
jgi:hypothetical protein